MNVIVLKLLIMFLLCEELGDLLLQIVFHARMAEEAGDFAMQDVIDGITQKLIRRHPHIFGDVQVADAGEVLVNWDDIKKKEKPERLSAIDGIPKGLPALMYAWKLQKKAAKVGFDWDGGKILGMSPEAFTTTIFEVDPRNVGHGPHTLLEFLEGQEEK